MSEQLQPQETMETESRLSSVINYAKDGLINIPDRLRQFGAVAAGSLTLGMGVAAESRAQDAKEDTAHPSTTFTSIYILSPAVTHRGGVAKARIAARGTAENFSVTLLSKSRYLKLQKEGTSDSWDVVDGKPTWDYGALDENNVNNSRHAFKVSRKAKIGSKVCATFKLTGQASAETKAANPNIQDTEKIQKDCITVKKK